MSLASLPKYELFIYTLQEQFPSIASSTLTLVRLGITMAMVRGEITFTNNMRLVVAEWLDFAKRPGRITAYGYEVWRGEEKLYWYDSQAHPNDPTLAVTDPHHKHIPPDIKHNRISAPGLSFDKPNLPYLIREVEALFTGG